MKNNYSLLKKIMLIVLPSIIIITSLILFIQSIEVFEGGFSANIDYIMVIVIAGEYLGLAIYYICNKDNLGETRNFVMLTSGLLLFGYPLGKFIKAMVKNKGFIDSQVFLYASIFGLALLIYGIFDYLEMKKSKENK